MADTDTKTFKPAVVQADFSDKNAIALMRDYTALSKRADVRSVMIVTVDSTGHLDWVECYESEHHALLMAMALDDIKADIKAVVFNEYLEDE